MFKPGEVATLSTRGDRTITILPDQPAKLNSIGAGEKKLKWPVATNEGVFDETELYPAHPSVIFTAESRDASAESFRKRMDNMAKEGESLPWELRDKVEKALKKASFDFNNHWKNGSIIDEGYKAQLLKTIMLGRESVNKDEAEAIVQAAKTKVALARWLPVNLYLSGLRTCSYCGEDDFVTETNGLVVRLAGPPCKYPLGLPHTEWELNVPSGKIVVANDLRTLFPLTDDDFDVNTTMGCRLTALAYAEVGLSHAFVGNSCPGVFKCSDGSLKIANAPQDEEWDGKKHVKIDPAPKFDGEHVAGVCTDLWWFSICDHDEFTRRLKHFKQKAKDYNIETVALKPGVYRFRHDEEARSYNGPGECVYTRFEWVREADPIKDLLGNYQQIDVNPHAYVQAQVARWPTLYGKAEPLSKDKGPSWSGMTEKDQLASWQRVADHVFCTLGGGTEWHEKGFPTAKVDPTIPDVDPPNFREQHHWYPFSKPHGGLFEPKTLSPSFAKLAFRVLESIISFGTGVRDGAHSRNVVHVRERMLVAVKRYRELAKMYPDQADPEYVAWLAQKGRAEAWVVKFDLGPVFTDKHRNHAAAQRWVPEGTYAVVFDARKLTNGHFAWHPKVNGGSWANKKDAQRYALNEHGGNGQPLDENNCFWASQANKTSVPLYSVARVVKLGEVSHMGETLVEVAYDYGTPWMLDSAKRKAITELGEKAGIQVLSKAEYEKLLPRAIKFFEASESKIAKSKKS